MTDQEFDNLTIRLAKADGNLYMSLAEYQQDVASPTYQRNEAFRQLCDARLEQSRHLWQENSSLKEGDVRGNDSMSLMINTSTGETRVVEHGTLGLSKPPDVRQGQDESTLEETGVSTILSVPTEF